MCRSNQGFRRAYAEHYQQSVVLRSVSAAVMNTLPIVTIPPADRTCAICTNEAPDDVEQQWMVLNCAHKFHPECIRPWLTEHNTCPLCRQIQSGDQNQSDYQNNRIEIIVT